MIIIFLQILCLFLIAVGSLFIIIELRAQFDKTFLFFGISLIFLSFLTAIDLWIMPTLQKPSEILYWLRIFHIVAAVFIPFFLWYLLVLTTSKNNTIMRIFVFAGIIIALLTFSDKMMTIQNGKFAAGIFYFILFVPFSLSMPFFAIAMILNRLKSCPAHERKLLRFHLFGICMLCVFGLMDLFTVAIPGATQKLSFIPSFAIIGVLLFGITATAIFVERFLFILQDRQQTYQKLHSAYKELEESRNLRELGQSVAMINHEIKNYLFMISGYADLLRSSETITAKGERMLNSIVDGTKKLNNFSQDILDLSKSRIIANKKLINISELVRECAQRSFPAQISKFTLPTASEKIYIYADWLKLENAFINMFKNSFEAGAKSICVRMSPQDNVLLVTIEDDGEGCDADALKELFKAFFTTKEKRSGTGLGLPLVKSIVESHGGHISVYSKNLAEDMQATGLKFEITFPIYGTDEKGEDLVPDRQHLPDPDLIVITEGLEQLDTILGIFQNVYMFPTTEKTAADIKFKTYHPQVRIIGTPESIDSVIKRYNVHEGLSIIKATESGLYILSLGEEKSEPHIFSEEYILTHLIETVEPGVAHRGKPQVASTEKITST